MSGDTLEFSEPDVSAMASSYNPNLMRAPLVLGHPKDNSPAYGWVNSLAFQDGLLQAMPDAVTPEFADWVNQGFYKTVSASIYPKTHPNNPTPGNFYLRHVGFLGGQPPAVKGLPPPEFADFEDLITLEFTEDNSMPEANNPEAAGLEALAAQKAELLKQIDELKQREAAFAEKETALNNEILALASEKKSLRIQELNDFAESLIKEGRLLPKDKLAVVEFMAGLSDTPTFEFGEGDAKTKTSHHAWLRAFLSTLPKQIEFGEMAGVQNPPEQLNDQQVAQRARTYHQQQHNSGNFISFSEAVDAVRAGLVGAQ